MTDVPGASASALVTGASGFIGSAVARALLDVVTAKPGMSTKAIEQTKPGGGVTAIRSELTMLEADG